ncbi:helix-loop-helix protein 6-like isoform X3 [Varroa jacobsoni]|nr:helix-loop-helix protein 6-like isoform X2 [Varroa destructor]XP_022671671.1 helix-loop-helix protein 6-like isoform X2 [Varroa destructor]XP_022671672.1 helix-loop-helix protein 6-like isoform X2 [Varroa destructor]XP_022692188.1 helix-loop-helix protein 6-like isoform X3 [Varroa jacobsoni]XP_022692189.1 helix-loop-helix protein 6-like isoform X3 [Varroa jacobsoni]XP_022692191.1 helix-loop-helix protein 6-like isoform X3 [Varroa jacobsoni]
MESPEPRSPPPVFETEQQRSIKGNVKQDSLQDSDRHTKSAISAKVQRLFTSVTVTAGQRITTAADLQRCNGAPTNGEDSSRDSCGGDDVTMSKDPFSPECKIPLPVAFAPFDYGWVEPSFIRKRNERERQRVRNVNDGFERLRSHLPLLNKSRDRRLSKVSRVETLRYAISYIQHLQAMLKD